MYLLNDIVNWPVDKYEKRAFEEYYSWEHLGILTENDFIL